MKPLFIYLIVLGAAGISSMAVLSADIDLTLQKFGTWNTVEDFTPTAENPNNLGFLCECDANGDGTFGEDECNVELECDANGDGTFTVAECDVEPEEGQEIPSQPVMPQGFMGDNANMLCTWEATVGTYGGALTDYFYGEGCDAEFWAQHSSLENSVWPAEYRPEYKFNEIFGTAININIQKSGYGLSEDGLTPFQIKLNAISDLEEFNSASTKSVNHIEKAIMYLKENTDESLWLDESHLGDEGLLKFYFNENRAVYELTRMIMEHIENPSSLDEIKKIIVDITESDKIIAETSYNDLELFLIQNNIDNEKFEMASKSMDNANTLFEESKEAVEKDFPMAWKLKFHQALTFYGKVWTFTHMAMDEVGYVEDVEPTLLDALLSAQNGRANNLETLAAHATAGLLNAAHDTVNYRYDVKETISMTQKSFLGENILELTGEFLEENDFGSPLCPTQ